MTESMAVETYFSKSEHLYPSLNDDGSIPTEQFLSACTGIAEFVGFLGTAFTPIKHDIAGNVMKVRAKFETDKERCATVQTLVECDLLENSGRMGVATEGLLWLKRGLEYMLQFLSLMVAQYGDGKDKAGTENLVSILRESYDLTLKRHHGFVSKQLFKLVIHVAPYRKDILRAVALGHDGLDDLCIKHINAHLDGFRLNVESLVDFYYKKCLEKPPVAK